MNKPQKKQKPISRTINANLHDHHITAQGVEDYYWPILHRDMSKFADKIMPAAATLLKQEKDQDSALIYKIVMSYFVNDACGMFQGDLLIHNLARDGVTLNVPSDWGVWPHLLQGKAPATSARLERLWRRTPKVSKWKKLLDPAAVLKIMKRVRFQGGKLTIDGMKISTDIGKPAKDVIYVTHRTDLIKSHVAHISQETVFCRSDKWFDTISEEEFQQSLKQRDQGIESRILKMVEDIYDDFGVNYSEASRGFNEECLRNMVALVRVHYQRLLRRDDLPANLWTGSGGNIWDCMLRLVVRRSGGYVVGHDHGGGSAHVLATLVGFIELWACDEFVSFNAQQVIEYQKAAKSWPLLGDDIPKISFVPHFRPPEFTIKDKFLAGKEGAEIKKIIFLSTLYDQDRGRVSAIYSDISYVDWQARCMAKLVEWGYDVYFKPHPESKTPPPAAFERDLGIKILHGRFEDMVDEADLFVFDYTYTSVFLPALQSNIPMVVIDFDEMPFHDGALELMKKRTAYVGGHYDKQNRIAVDWQELKKAVEGAPQKRNNHEFVNKYFL